ncbi:GGDEF domain-containing protein [Lyngbya confervoides]|uniref:GGDEF domain-containing protein n=1 Tax=Lyngbya confervoides BDU141951 TaxID=1574623 RepID=A0ABD4T1U2_9CYAN|nr:GGDEF domain-containing protein [Lyngbya confervoides]MCM1982395.1 GGDEF domain-containing protein [Lyngbya confervoides BDU141951]
MIALNIAPYMISVRTILEALDRQSRVTLWSLTLGLIIGLTLLDYGSGYELSFAVFYLLPISLVAWSISQRGAYAISLLCAILWLIANKLAGESLPSLAYEGWNTLTRFIFFSIVSALTAEVKHLLVQEKQLARLDTLTGAFNRRAFYESLALVKAQSDRNPLTVMYLDLDNFKQINDQFGHQIGDAVLTTVVTELLGSVRSCDRVIRMGGDEFIVLLMNTDAARAEVVVPRIQASLLQAMQLQNWTITFSIGVMSYLTLDDSIETLLQRSDALMYAVKRNGKNAILYAVQQTEDL